MALDENYAEAWTNLGLMLMEDGQLDEALACQERACTAAPDSAIAHSNRGLVLDELRRVPEAEEAMRIAVQLTPDSAGPCPTLPSCRWRKAIMLWVKTCSAKRAADPEYLTAALFLSNLLLRGVLLKAGICMRVRYH